MPDEELLQSLLKSLGKIYHMAPSKIISGFTHGENKILNQLYITDGFSLSPKELSEILFLSSARVAAALKTLEQKGRVRRSVSETDRRKICVSLTREGEEIILAKRTEINSIIGRVIDKLGSADSAQLVRLIDRIIEITEMDKEAEI
ncbi:MAG: MarR family transcriptional regulator [Oscillospiraceae bacterium]